MHVHGFPAPARVPEVPGGGVQVGERRRRHAPRRAPPHFLDQRSPVRAGEHFDLVRTLFAQRQEAIQRLPRFILDIAHGRGGPGNFHDQIHAHVSHGLHEQRKLGGLPDSLVIFQRGLGVDILRRRERDDGVGAYFLRVFRVSDRSRQVRALHADDNGRPQLLARGGDGLGAFQSLPLGQGGPLAGHLRPDEAVHPPAVDELHLLHQGRQIELVRFRKWRLGDGEDAAQRFGCGLLRGEQPPARQGEAQRTRRQQPQEFPPARIAGTRGHLSGLRQCALPVSRHRRRTATGWRP